ncbi:MAG: cysteine protease [Cyanobium sp.]|uniref:transglutaminase family protein n=1 Tax=Synechococcus sp. CS-1333 TaxID=2848638 RepID=UPI000DBC2068|nr:transglutaminase family protein [Synechococcus sp. CS-1333]MCT0211897.1 transglutaminase family protein [Synechococcus sp. CS-1333]PZV22659.1 MAG: cysteine protease [Cyanobium sp.]
MNRYQIVHRTAYNYSGAVQLGSHELRLRPREGHNLRIESSRITIQPTACLRWHRDVEDNSVAIASFRAPADLLLIESSLIIQQYDQEPLDFLVEDYAVSYPFTYVPEDRPVLDAYLLTVPAPQAGPLAQWTSTVWQAGVAIESYSLLQRLNLAIHELISYRQREEPGVQTPAETLSRASGSCRDLAFLFMEAAKLLGFPARFVSGYSCTTHAAVDAGSTHAWAEVFLPGAGWKGFDPTRGEIVGENHISVAVGRLPHSVPPIAGSYIGDSRLLSMDVAVRVRRL